MTWLLWNWLEHVCMTWWAITEKKQISVDTYIDLYLQHIGTVDFTGTQIYWLVGGRKIV